MKIEKRIRSTSGEFIFLQVAFIAQVKRYELSYLSKDKKLEKVYITACINPIQHGLFWGCSRMGWGGAKSPPP